MKKKWKRLAAFLAVVALGAGNHVLFALDQKETKNSLENGASIEAVADAAAETEKKQEGLVSENATENTVVSVPGKVENKIESPKIGGGGRAERQKRALKI